MFPARIRSRSLSLPPPGSKAIFVGDSITDPNANMGGWAAKLTSFFGWQLQGGNAFVVANTSNNFEAETTGWVANGATLASDATRAAHGSKSLMITATAATNWTNPGGDTGALQFNMQPTFTYTFGVDIYVPVGTAGTINLVFLDRVGAGAYNQTASATIAPANAWQRIYVTRTLLAGATEAFLRVSWSGATVGAKIWVDGAVLEPGSIPSAWADNTLRPAIAGTLLQSTDNFANNFQANTATRFGAWAAGGCDIAVLYMGTNDLSQIVLPGNNKTAATWRAALEASIQAFNAINPPPLIVICSLGSLTTYADATATPQWGTGWTRAMVYASMNAITQQVCRDYGALYLNFTNETDAMTVDHIHPNQSGNDYFYTQFKALFGQ